jgi:hypothetical protein
MMQGRNWRPLARYTATRIVGLAALGGFAALGLATLGTEAAHAATATAAGATNETPPVVTSVSFTIDLRVQVPTQNAIEWRASGEANFTRHAVKETVTIPTTGLRALNEHTAGILPGQKPLVLEVKLVDGHAYVDVPTSVSHLVSGAQTLSVPVSLADIEKVDLELDQSAVALTYSKVLLNELSYAGGGHHAGTRTMNGVAVSGTRVDLTLAQLLKVAPGLTPTMVGDSTGFGNATFPVTVWTDHAGRLMEVAIAATPKSAAPSISGTVEFSHFNAPTTIAAPAARTVTPITPTVQQLLSGLSYFGDIPLP